MFIVNTTSNFYSVSVNAVQITSYPSNFSSLSGNKIGEIPFRQNLKWIGNVEWLKIQRDVHPLETQLRKKEPIKIKYLIWKQKTVEFTLLGVCKLKYKNHYRQLLSLFSAAWNVPVNQGKPETMFSRKYFQFLSKIFKSETFDINLFSLVDVFLWEFYDFIHS